MSAITITLLRNVSRPMRTYSPTLGHSSLRLSTRGALPGFRDFSTTPALHSPSSQNYNDTSRRIGLSLKPRRLFLLSHLHYAWSTTRSHSTDSPPPTRRENIYTLPNLLTVSRILACPVLGWSIIEGSFGLATGLLAYAGITDLVPFLYKQTSTSNSPQLDGHIARTYKTGTVIGSILDPAADKTLMTTLVVSLAYKSMIPCQYFFTSWSVH